MSFELTPIEAAFQEAADGRIGGLEAQQWVGRYRVDFMVRDHRLVIELDGHDYHKTKEQRTADAIRQRALQRQGWTVIRFTGSEIFRDVQQCVRETAEQLAASPTFDEPDQESDVFCCIRMQEIITHLCEKHGVGFPENFYTKLSLVDGWLPLSIEKHGRSVSIKHFFEQNGDIVFDPCIDFCITSRLGDYPDWVPLAMQTLFSYRACAEMQDDGDEDFRVVDRGTQQDIANFAELWAKNLRMQGWIDDAVVVESKQWTED